MTEYYERDYCNLCDEANDSDRMRPEMEADYSQDDEQQHAAKENLARLTFWNARLVHRIFGNAITFFRSIIPYKPLSLGSSFTNLQSERRSCSNPIFLSPCRTPRIDGFLPA